MAETVLPAASRAARRWLCRVFKAKFRKTSVPLSAGPRRVEARIAWASVGAAGFACAGTEDTWACEPAVAVGLQDAITSTAAKRPMAFKGT